MPRPRIARRQRLVISDLDGTLYKSDGLQRAFELAFVRHVAAQLRLATEVAEERLHNLRQRLERISGIPPSEFRLLEALGVTQSSWLEFSSTQIQPEQHLVTNPLLHRAVSAVRQYAYFDIATNTARVIALRTLQQIGLRDQVDGLWAGEDVAGGKPSLAVYQEIAELRSVEREKILVIGDRWHIDLIGLDHLGIRGVLVEGPVDVSNLLLEFAGSCACQCPR